MANESSKQTRRYRKSARAEQEGQTRERITRAAVKLHGTVGPARTTVSGVAREAGVQRATVYRHFPTEESLFEACTAHYYAAHPQPDVAGWSAIPDPDARLRFALAELYAWFAETEQMLERVSRDRGRVPAMRHAAAAFLAYFEEARATLLRGRPERGRRRERASAAIGHALAFPTWQSLVSVQGLPANEAVEMMVAMTRAA